MDIAGMGHDTYSTSRDASKAMERHIMELAKAGFLLGARRRYLLLTDDSDLAPTPWRSIDIEIQPAYLALRIEADGQPLQRIGDI